MSKHKKRFLTNNLNNDPLTKNGPMSNQKHIDHKDVNLQGNTSKKISGIWPLIIYISLFVLVFILGWLTR